MALELYYTSAPRGLRPGSTGFCTVGMTEGMSPQMAEKLEALGGYRPVYDVGSPCAPDNPPAFAHWRLNIAGRFYSVLSHVCFAGADHQGRFNKFAHHLVLDSSEQVAAGPAWVMMQPGVMERRWTGDPRALPVGKNIPDGANPLRLCQGWAELTGDAGWAGMLANAYMQDASKPAYVIYRPGTDMVSLINEALTLLPEGARWRVTFNTYFDTLPAGLTCGWRCVVAGTPAARSAAANATSGVVIDLTTKLGQAPANKYVQMARTGEPGEPPQGPTRGGLVTVTAPFEALEREYQVADTEPSAPTETLPRESEAFSDTTIESAIGPRHIPHRRLAADFPRRRSLFWAAVILWPLVVLGGGGYFLWNKAKEMMAPPPPAPTEAAQVGTAALAQRLQEHEGTIASLRSELAKANGKINEQAGQLADANSTIAMLNQKLAGTPSTGGATTVAVADPNRRSPGNTSTQTGPVTPVAVSLTAKVREFPKPVIPGGSTFTEKPTGFTALCNAPPGASFRMVFPTELQDPLRYEASGGAFQIQYRPKGGDWAALGVAQVKNGELSWQWLELDVGNNPATVRALGTVMQYAVLQAVDSTGKTIGELLLFDPAKQFDELAQALTKPGFGPLKLTATLGADPGRGGFYYPMQVLRPGNLTSTDGNWVTESLPTEAPTICKSLLKTNSDAKFTVELSPVDPLHTRVQVAWTTDSTVPEINKAIRVESDRIPKLVESNDQWTRKISSGLSAQHREKKDALDKGRPGLENRIWNIEKKEIPALGRTIGEKKDEIAKKMKLSDFAKNLPRNDKGEIDEGKRNDQNKADFDRWYARRAEVRKAQDEDEEIRKLAGEVRQLETERDRQKEQLTKLQKEFGAIDGLLNEATTNIERAQAGLRTAQAEKSRLQAKLKDVTSPRTIVVKVPAATSKAILAEMKVEIPKGGGG
jgi:hypothetical protein